MPLYTHTNPIDPQTAPFFALVGVGRGHRNVKVDDPQIALVRRRLDRVAWGYNGTVRIIAVSFAGILHAVNYLCQRCGNEVPEIHDFGTVLVPSPQNDE